MRQAPRRDNHLRLVWERLRSPRTPFSPTVGLLERLKSWIRRESDRPMSGRSTPSPFRRCLSSTSVSVEKPSCCRAMLGLGYVGRKTRKGWVGLYRRPGNGSTILPNPQKTPQSPSLWGLGGILTAQFVLPRLEQEYR